MFGHKDIESEFYAIPLRFVNEESSEEIGNCIRLGRPDLVLMEVTKESLGRALHILNCINESVKMERVTEFHRNVSRMRIPQFHLERQRSTD